jgi:hypothetical protein
MEVSLDPREKIRAGLWMQPLQRQSRRAEGVQIQQLPDLASPSKGEHLVNL